MAGSTQYLDAPDLGLRRIMQKRKDGARLTDAEYRRIGARQSVEAETTRSGGAVARSIQPQKQSLSAYEQGQVDQENEDDYAAGRGGRPQGSTRRAPIPGASMGGAPGSATISGGDARTNYGRLSVPRTDIDAQGNLATPSMTPPSTAPKPFVATDDQVAAATSGAPEPRPAGVQRVAQAAPAPSIDDEEGMTTSQKTAAMRRAGPIDVNSYRGSMWSQSRPSRRLS